MRCPKKAAERTSALGEVLKKTVFLSQVGCFLPFLIFFNFFFGLFFLKFIHWLLLESVLIALFLLNSTVLLKKFSGMMKKDINVIDVEGEVVEEKKHLKSDS